MQYTDFKVFNPTTAQLTTQDRLSLYSVPPTCFGRSMAIDSEVSNKGMQERQILLQMCICAYAPTHICNRILRCPTCVRVCQDVYNRLQWRLKASYCGGFKHTNPTHWKFNMKPAEVNGPQNNTNNKQVKKQKWRIWNHTTVTSHLPVYPCRHTHPSFAWHKKFSFGHSQGIMQWSP
jgi:hypothetical protein